MKDSLKRILSTPMFVVPTGILTYAFFVGKVNGIVALLVLGLMLVFTITDSGNKPLWK